MNKFILAMLFISMLPAQAFAVDTLIQTDRMKLGRPNANNKDIIFDINASAANPRVRANGTTGKLQFTNDGTIFQDVVSVQNNGGGAGFNYLADANGQLYPLGSSWTVTAGTGSADTVNFTEGKQSIKVTAASQQSKLSQDLTPLTQINGQNMQATMWVKTSLSNVQVCARLAGSPTNCQAVSSANTWAPYTSTFTGPSSGTMGIEVSMTGSGTGSFNAQLGYVGKIVPTWTNTPISNTGPRSEIIYNGWAGSGAGTTVGYFTSQQSNVGTAFQQISNDAISGLEVKLLEDGVYSVMSGVDGPLGQGWGVTRNSTNLASGWNTQSAVNILVFGLDLGGDDYTQHVSRSFIGHINDRIRPQYDSTPGSGAARVIFSITKISN